MCRMSRCRPWIMTRITLILAPAVPTTAARAVWSSSVLYARASWSSLWAMSVAERTPGAGSALHDVGGEGQQRGFEKAPPDVAQVGAQIVPAIAPGELAGEVDGGKDDDPASVCLDCPL